MPKTRVPQAVVIVEPEDRVVSELPEPQKVPCPGWTSDGNAFFIMGKVSRCMKEAGRSEQEIKVYVEEAKSGDYDNLLRATMEVVDDDPMMALLVEMELLEEEAREERERMAVLEEEAREERERMAVRDGGA